MQTERKIKRQNFILCLRSTYNVYAHFYFKVNLIVNITFVILFSLRLAYSWIGVLRVFKTLLNNKQEKGVATVKIITRISVFTKLFIFKSYPYHCIFFYIMKKKLYIFLTILF